MVFIVIAWDCFHGTWEILNVYRSKREAEKEAAEVGGKVVIRPFF